MIGYGNSGVGQYIKQAPPTTKKAYKSYFPPEHKFGQGTSPIGETSPSRAEIAAYQRFLAVRRER